MALCGYFERDNDDKSMAGMGQPIFRQTYTNNQWETRRTIMHISGSCSIYTN